MKMTKTTQNISFDLDLLALCFSSSIYCFERRYVELENFYHPPSQLKLAVTHTWEETMLKHNMHAVDSVKLQIVRDTANKFQHPIVSFKKENKLLASRLATIVK